MSKFWTISVEDVVNELNVDTSSGLSSEEIKTRQAKYGKNKLKEHKQRSKVSILLDQIKSILVIILIFAVIISFIFGEYIEAVAITVVIIINTLIGYFTEVKAVRSMEALRKLVQTEARVIRYGELQMINAEELVPGDIVDVEAGDIISADLRLFESSKLRIDESPLTGESVPVDKSPEVIDDAPLAERTNMLYNGTSVTRGSGKGIVVRTGLKTEVGKISDLVEEAGTDQETPLEHRLEELGKNLVWLSGIVIILIVIVGLYRGEDLFLLIETALALAVATVPEGLPIVATITLARGMKRMADQNALVNKLSSVETLGSTNTIATDKTGTLTENTMTLTKYLLVENGKVRVIEVSGRGMGLEGEFSNNGTKITIDDDRVLTKALIVGVLCNNANVSDNGAGIRPTAVGDPTETALLVAGEKAGMSNSDLQEKFPEVREVSFDPRDMMMATYNEIENGNYMVAVKGSPPEVINNSTSFYQGGQMSEDDRQYWNDKNDEIARAGNRVLALAVKTVTNPEEPPYSELEFIGLTALLDPPRYEVKDTIRKIHEAGIRTVMITGDQELTAVNISKELEISQNLEPKVMPGHKLQDFETLTIDDKRAILETDIFYRVEPKEKLNLVKVYQESQNTIAMTGDGINDAPALRRANIGVAMGQRGTQVAKQSADMILQDDNFSTIEEAIEEGRNIFKSIQKFVYYLLSCNISEIMVIFFATLFLLPLPIRPIQILYLNIVTDVFPAFALSMNESDDRVMLEKPREKSDPIISNKQWTGIVSYGLVLTFTVLTAFVFAIQHLGVDEATAVTIGYVTLGFSQVGHVFNMRDSDSSPIFNQVTRNKNVWYAVVISIAMVLITVYVPGLNTAMRAVPLSFEEISWVIGFCFIPILIGLGMDKLNLK